VAVTLSLILFQPADDLLSAKSKKMKPDELVALHLDSIGSPQIRAKALYELTKRGSTTEKREALSTKEINLILKCCRENLSFLSENQPASVQPIKFHAHMTKIMEDKEDNSKNDASMPCME